MEPKTRINYPSVEFWVFRHGIRNLCSTYQRQSIKTLVKDLSENTLSLTILPMSLIWAIHQRKNHKDKLTSRYTGQY